MEWPVPFDIAMAANKPRLARGDTCLNEDPTEGEMSLRTYTADCQPDPIKKVALSHGKDFFAPTF